MYEKNSRIYLDRLLKKKHRDYKGTKYSPVSCKIQEYRRNWLQYVNRSPVIEYREYYENYGPTGRRK